MGKSLDGKLALVTGAGSGIGRATALALAEAGARVAVVDIDDARVAEVKRELGEKCALAKRVDVSKKEEMAALADEVHAASGALDVLVNNAGVGHSGGILDSTLDDWSWVVGVNLWGVVYGCHYFVPKMVARGAGGHVVNVASGFGLVAGAGVAPYCTTKFAVVGLSESMRGELAPHGIGVSAICPGVIDTDIVARGRFADESLRDGAVKTFRKRGHPPERVARAVLRAIRRDVAVVPVGPEAWAGWLGKRIAPGLTAMAGRRMEKLARNGG
ncbi:MAG TPA: SDR family NAD(P)-dependent oxidoreductase [Polyangiaceae bacterium]|jgi:NAD(P)-dependent dehydrogenase (short-subunit alcohol dehydrogenase family)